MQATRSRRHRARRGRRGGRGTAVILILVLAAALLVGLIVRGVTALGRKEALPQATVPCTVVVDAGHGGNDQGASFDGRLESEDNLRLALAVQRALQDRGITAVLTREGDTALTLEERVAAAEDAGADFFLSLHRNFSDGAGYGTEVWTAEQCSARATQLAEAIRAGLTAVGVQRDRGVRAGSQSGTGDYYVLAHTTMPAVLVEMGFVENEADNRLFDQHLEDYAAAIAQAVMDVSQPQEAAGAEG